jgi:hypothetical protein
MTGESMTLSEIEYAIDEQAKEASLDLGMPRDDLAGLASQMHFAIFPISHFCG